MWFLRMVSVSIDRFLLIPKSKVVGRLEVNAEGYKWSRVPLNYFEKRCGCGCRVMICSDEIGCGCGWRR